MSEPTFSDVGKRVQWFEPAPISKTPMRRTGTLLTFPSSTSLRRLATVAMDGHQRVDGTRPPAMVDVHPGKLQLIPAEDSPAAQAAALLESMGHPLAEWQRDLLVRWIDG